LAQWKAPTQGLILGTLDVDVTDMIPRLERLGEEAGHRISLGVLVGKAIADSLAKMPELNGRVIGRKIFLKDSIDIYYQVDVEGGGDLAGTVIGDVDKKSLPDIARELTERAKKIRSGKDEVYEKTQKRGIFRWSPIWLLSLLLRLMSFLLYRVGVPARYLGAKDTDPFGSVMVTNVGPMGIDVGYAPLVPWTLVPMVVVVGSAKDVPVVRDGEIIIRTVLPLSATIDHRIADGAHLGRFIKLIRSFIEHAAEETVRPSDEAEVRSAPGPS